LTTYGESFERAVAAAMAGATVVTANTRSARGLKAAAERRLRSSGAWPTPEVLPYGAFVERLYAEALVAGLATAQALQHEQELQLWRQIIASSASGREMLLPDAAAALARESFSQAMEFGVTLDPAQMSASSDTRAFSGWAREFRRQVAARGWTCEAMLARELAPHLRELQLPEELFVFAEEITPAQREFLDALGEAGVGITRGAGFDVAAETRAQRHTFDGVSDELRTAATWARQQVEANPDARVGVVLFDLERKLAQVESTFRAVLNPEQLLEQGSVAAFEIASALPLGGYPVVRCALQLLELFAGPVEFDSFHALLRSPYLAADAEAAAKFVTGVRKKARRQVSLEDFSFWLHEREELAQLRTAMDGLKKHSAFSSEQPAAYWADIAREILKAFGWPGKVKLSSEEYQCTEKWRELLTAIASLELLEWRTDFGGFVARLERAAAGRKFKPETRGAPVQIMDANEAEGSVFDALWIGSCSDELWPDAPRGSALLPIALLKDAGVALVGTEQWETRIERVTARLLQSAPRVVLSLARRTDDEREQRWSPAFARIEEADEEILMARPLAERFAKAEMEEVKDSAAPALGDDEEARGGSKLLEDQSNCPFRAFAVRRLLAKEDEGPNEALAPTERGSLVDRALQLIWEELKDSAGLQRADRAAVVERAVDQAMVDVLPPSANAWTARFRQLERERTVDVLTQWLAVEERRKAFRVVGHQIEVETDVGGLKLRGRLDRLDEVDGAHVVIDYKTGGSNQVSAWQVPRPRQPQLPFYTLAMQKQGRDVAGATFAIVRNGECGFLGYVREKDMLPCSDPAKRCFDGMTFNEYSALWANELERIADGFVRGEAAVDPKSLPGMSGTPCQYCHLTALCRIGELTAGEPDEGEDNE
jgi:probable DNA repair protein